MSYYISTSILDPLTSSPTHALPLEHFALLADARHYCYTRIRVGQAAIQEHGINDTTIPVHISIHAQSDNQLVYEYFGRIVKGNQ
jgi:hypothetical protein